jgi:quercetin dioxygenase-like cupin family protein
MPAMPSPENAEPTSPGAPAPVVRAFSPGAQGYRWAHVPLKTYKQDGTHFKDITRQVLFGETEGLDSQLRYFEIDPGGYSTFERHEHVHAVLILRGRGRALVGDELHALTAFDLVYVPPHTWHQFQADPDNPLGFLCLVACDRDRPVRPSEAEKEQIRAHPTLGPLVRL